VAITGGRVVPDFKLGFLRPNEDILSPLDGIGTRGIEDVVGAFTGNVKGVQSLCRLVPELYFWGNIDGLHRAMAWEPVLHRTYVPDQLPDAGREPELIRVANEMTAKSLEKYRSKKEYEDLIWNGANADINVLQINSGEWLTNGIESVLSGIIVGTWTVFESLTEDLWIACVNANAKLGLAAIDAAKIANESRSAEYDRFVKAIDFVAKLFKRAEPGLEVGIGEILGAQWKFDRREEARNAWLKVFNTSSDDLKKILDHKSLRWINTIRNAIVHDNGRCLPKDVTNLSDHPRLASVTPHKRIPLDGETVAELSNETLARGVELVRFAAQWLAANKE
jgi:hypothetical protein